MKNKIAFAMFSIGALVAEPCLAANELSDFGYSERRSGTFAGAAVKMELGGKSRSVPTARLQLGMTHRFQGVGASSRSFNVSVLELGLSEAGRPSFSIGGQTPSRLQRRLGVKGSTGTALLVGGVALAALAAILVVTDEQECALPEGGC